MRLRFPGQRMFIALVAAQALHSVEEWYFELWRIYPPARQVVETFGSNLPVTFAVLNAAFLMLMIASLVAFHRRGRFLVPLAMLWILVELINGTNHIAQAFLAGGYFPGVYTAPLLLLFAGGTALHVYRQARSADT